MLTVPTCCVGVLATAGVTKGTNVSSVMMIKPNVRRKFFTHATLRAAGHPATAPAQRSEPGVLNVTRTTLEPPSHARGKTTLMSSLVGVDARRTARVTARCA